AITSPSNGCNDLYPLEFAVQLLNGTRDDRLDEVLLKMNLCSTEQRCVSASKIVSVWRSVVQKRPTYAEMEWHAPSLANAPSDLSATCRASMRRTGYCWATFCIDEHKSFRLVGQDDFRSCIYAGSSKRQDFSMVALLVCAEYNGRVDTLNG
ncbi:hypothetical protein EMCRGX_G003166, partial [Ephydatia muelleri]